MDEPSGFFPRCTHNRRSCVYLLSVISIHMRVRDRHTSPIKSSHRDSTHSLERGDQVLVRPM